MQPVRPAASVHHSPGKLVDDDDLAFLDDIIGIALENDVRLHRLIEVMADLGVLIIIEIITLQQPRGFEHPLDLFGAVLGKHHRALLLNRRHQRSRN